MASSASSVALSTATVGKQRQFSRWRAKSRTGQPLFSRERATLVPGATVVLEKVGGRWVALRLTNQWVTEEFFDAFVSSAIE